MAPIAKFDRGRRMRNGDVMKLCQGAALAAIGWYLMLPPVPKTGTPPDTTAPLNTWGSEGAFDTARECQAYLVELNDLSSQRRTQLFASNDPARRGYLTLALPAGRCIATDDLRLKSK